MTATSSPASTPKLTSLRISPLQSFLTVSNSAIVLYSFPIQHS